MSYEDEEAARQGREQGEAYQRRQLRAKGITPPPIIDAAATEAADLAASGIDPNDAAGVAGFLQGREFQRRALQARGLT